MAEEAAEGAGEEGPSIIVYGRPEGYDIKKTPTATKTDTPLIDVPQSVTVLSREQLDDQGLEQLGEALRYVPGVVLGQGEGHRDQVTLRGQNSTADFFLDGLRDDAQYYRPLYNVERVEVLKGANAMIFGRGGGGGVINRVSKVPEYNETIRKASAGVDSFGAWTIAADLGQPLSDTVAVRLNATHEEFNNHRDAYKGHFTGVTPEIGFRLGDRTQALLSYEFADDDRVTDRGVPSLSGAPITGQDDTFFGDPAINRSTVEAHIARARLDHEFSDAFSANLQFQYANYDKYYANIYPRSATATTVTVEGYESWTDRENLVVQGNLLGKFETGPLRHKVLIGFEAIDQTTDNGRTDAKFGVGGTANTTVAITRPLALPAIAFGGNPRSTHSDVRSLSAYIQNQIEIGDHVQVVAGLRYDDFRIATVNRINNFAAERTDGKWSPRVGLILKPQGNVSLYASYAISFLPQSGDQFSVLDATTATLAPEEFRNLEAGVKWDITPSLAFTAAAYRLDRLNTRATDPVNGNTVLTGKSRATGFEAALIGQVTRDFQLTLGYALQEGEIRATTTAAPAGRTLAQLPRHQFSAWTRYDVTPKLGLGLGLIHQSSSFATISNAVNLPAFTRIDAAVFYKVNDALQLQLNVENLTDEDYFPSAHTDNNISTGKPLNARLTARVKF
ncbi:TonB-dependent siderophore receptor [Novosphingobium sp. TH158]|nr:TonB-dependent siderophore receptor [Novosphingobium sp. TH158]